MNDNQIAKSISCFQSDLAITVIQGSQESSLQLWQELFQHDANLLKEKEREINKTYQLFRIVTITFYHFVT